MQIISVRPVQGGWSVEASFNSFPLAFLSAVAAERQAYRWAKLHARRGESHHVVVYGGSGLVTNSRIGIGGGRGLVSA